MSEEAGNNEVTIEPLSEADIQTDSFGNQTFVPQEVNDDPVENAEEVNNEVENIESGESQEENISGSEEALEDQAQGDDDGQIEGDGDPQGAIENEALPEDSGSQESGIDQNRDINAELESIINEKTAGQYSDIDSLIAAANKEPEKLEPEFEHPLLQELHQKLKDNPGMDVESFLDVSRADYSKLGNLDAYVERLKIESPGISKEEIDAELYEFGLLKNSDSQLQEMIENGDITQGKVNSLRAKEIRLGRESRNILNENKNKLLVDFNQGKSDQPQQGSNQVDPNHQAQAKKWMEVADQTMNMFSEDTFKLSDEVNYKYSVAKSKEEVGKYLKNPQSIFDIWKMDDNGMINLNKMASDIHLILNRDNIVNTISSQAQAIGKENYLKNKGNITLDKSTKRQQPDSTTLTVDRQKTNAMLEFHHPNFKG
jgi:hypothetical protein